MQLLRVITAVLLLATYASASSGAEPSFKFESVTTRDEMVALVRSMVPLGTSRTAVRAIFVKNGQATLIVKPDDPKIEKYIYDLDLCQYYIWRWNISADYDDGDRLRQIYVNGNIVHPDGNPLKVVLKVAEPGKKASIYKAKRPRPEAHKGETSLSFVMFDRDSDFTTTNDQVIVGAGPSRADPMNMGTIIAYSDVDPWRSIFDSDPAERIVPYRGDCMEVDRRRMLTRPQ